MSKLSIRLQEYMEDKFDVVKNDIENLDKKEEILENNRQNYIDHKAILDDKKLQEFAEQYAKYKRSETYKYELDFNKKMSKNINVV